MKKLLKVLTGFVIIVLIAVAAVFYATSGIVETADEFFEAVKHQDLAKAREYLAEEFKASVDEAELKDFLVKSLLINFKETSWHERSISNGRGELGGSVVTETGGSIPVHIVLVKEQDLWKIYSLQKPVAGIVESATSVPSALSLPNQQELIVLTKKSIHDFALSVKRQSMEGFRQTISSLWQKQFSKEKLDESYGSLFGAGADFTTLDSMEPNFDGEAIINEDGVLIVKGSYPTKPNTVFFEHKYIFEGMGWRLLGFNISVK